MARLYTFGFETQSGAVPDPINVVSGWVTTVARTGSWSCACQSPGGSFTNSIAIAGATARDYYGRVYLYVTSLPSTRSSIVGVYAAGGEGGYIYLETNGTLTANDATGTLIPGSTASAAIPLNQWLRVEVHVKLNVSTNDDTFEARLDGSTFYSTTTANLGTTAMVGISVGGGFGTGAGYIDDVAFNDGTGAAQNSWPGEGKVVLLRPTADSAKGTGWTNDAAGTSNFFDAVDNTPPVGITDTTASTGLHQIRNATSNANSNYDATMTTYQAAGINSRDTISVIDPFVATGAPVTTSSKQGTVGLVSNPAITNVALSATGTAGAFWSGVTASAFDIGWKASHGTVTYGSSVTVGTAPVMRITQVTSSTRIAMVCFMGITVEYVQNPVVRPVAILQARNRASSF